MTLNKIQKQTQKDIYWLEMWLTGLVLVKPSAANNRFTFPTDRDGRSGSVG